jgi:ribosome-associated translation inhibitor RaiA
MKIQVHYKNIAMSESINNFIRDELETMLQKFHANNNPSVDVYIESIRARTPNRHPVFSCEFIYKNGSNRSPQKIVRQGRDLFMLISDSLYVVEQRLTEMSSRKADHRRYQRRENRVVAKMA